MSGRGGHGSGDFEGKTAIVTGGGSGIGAALAEELSRRGARVVVADLDPDRAAEVALRVGGRSARLDVTDGAAFQELAAKVTREDGRIDLLFNNAGVGVTGAVEDLTLADWRRVVDVNLWGVIHGVDAVYPQMIRQRSGYIVNTASGAGLSPRPGMTPYAAAKHAVVGLSTSLRAEAAPHGIGVSVLCPGYVATNIVRSSRHVNTDVDAMMAKIPFRPMTAEACARSTLRGVEARAPIIVPSAQAWLEWIAFRISPALSLRIAAFRAAQFRAHRTGTKPTEGGSAIGRSGIARSLSTRPVSGDTSPERHAG